jgi:tRNA(fMet)-specific endonuclease VapC
MADKSLMVDSTILIDYFRKTNKEKSLLVKHSIEYNTLYLLHFRI